MRAQHPAELGCVGELLADTFEPPLGADVYAANSLVPGRLPIEISFAQAKPSWLRIDFEPLARATPEQRRSASEAAFMSDVRRWCSPESAHAAADALSASTSRGGHFGAYLGATTDAVGVTELKLYREVEPTGQGLSPAWCDLLARVSRRLPASPHLLSLSCTQHAAEERLYLRLVGGAPLRRIVDIAEELGLGDRAPALVRTLMVLGVSMFLAPDTALLGLRRRKGRWELKLDLLPGAIAGGANAARVALQRALSEDPGADRHFARWLAAAGPGDISVVGVRVAPGLGPSINVYLHPHFDERRSS